MRPKFRRVIWIAPLAILGMLAFIAIGSVIVQQLWNWLLPPLFGWHQITFWQALVLLVLCRILFGGIAGRGFRGSAMRGRIRENIADRMADRIAERFEAFTPEEKERFRQRMRERWSCGPSASESKGQS